MIKKNMIFAGTVVALLMISLIPNITPYANAHPHSGSLEINEHTHEPQTVIIPINDMIGIEKTVLLMHAENDNALSWGFVEGKIANHVADYPVIIQMYNENGEAAHFAQTNVEQDGMYEYKFRVQSIDNGESIHLFEGDYWIHIFKVVYLNNDLSLV